MQVHYGWLSGNSGQGLTSVVGDLPFRSACRLAQPASGCHHPKTQEGGEATSSFPIPKKTIEILQKESIHKMGKKRKLGQRWPPENFAELFAWLNYSLEHEAIKFTDTILEHLKASCGTEYTFKQVDRKLRTVWDSLGWTPDSQYTWKDLYKHGSQILSRLTDEQRASISLAQARIEDEVTTRLLSPCARPRTRSTSKSDNWPSSPHISLETIQTKQKPQRYSRALTGSLTPSPAKRESESVDLGAYNSPQPIKRAKKTSLLV
jgi:hypothetical protein